MYKEELINKEIEEIDKKLELLKQINNDIDEGLKSIEKLKKEEKALEYLAVFICGLFLGYIINLL